MTPGRGANGAASLAVLLASAALELPTVAEAGEGRRLHLACARGAAPVCRTLLANPKLSPGLRLAITQQLADIEELLARCEASARDACSEAIRRLPELPAPVLDALGQRHRSP